MFIVVSGKWHHGVIHYSLFQCYIGAHCKTQTVLTLYNINIVQHINLILKTTEGGHIHPTEPPPVNSTTMHSRLVCQYRISRCPEQLKKSICQFIGLIQVKEERWTGFSEEQTCQPEENPVHPDSFTWIYVLFIIGHFGDISDFCQTLMFKEPL